MHIKSEVLKEIFFRTFDKAQAYELEMWALGRETPKELKESLVRLHKFTYLGEEVSLRDLLKQTNMMLDRLISELGTEAEGYIKKYMKVRSETPEIEEEIKRRLKREAESINMLIESMNGICNEEVTQKIHTEDGKLIKERVCVVCSSTFNSNRKNAKYCSSKCKQAGYREKKDRYSNSLI
jgi:hypothetical protein